MKTNIFFLFTVVMACLLSSCQKVIKLKLDTSPSQIVIQGNVYDQPGPYTINITKSVSFDQSNVYPAITGAAVTISDNVGNTEVLNEKSPGNYLTSSLQGIPGRTYNLTVNIDGQIYQASSTMPNPVSIDSIYYTKSPFGKDMQLTVKFLDPADTINYYRLVEFINNGQQDRFNIASDRLYQGNPIIFTFPVEDDNDKKLVTGDHITVWLESIDKNVYEYFRTARRDGSQSTSPANPVSNISNGVLGYFNASPVRKATSIVP
jgi:hypothetical protein